MQSEMNKKLTDPETRDETLLEIGEWVKDTSLLFGVSPDTAFVVSGIFVRGLKLEVAPNNANARNG